MVYSLLLKDVKNTMLVIETNAWKELMFLVPREARIFKNLPQLFPQGTHHCVRTPCALSPWHPAITMENSRRARSFAESGGLDDLFYGRYGESSTAPSLYCGHSGAQTSSCWSPDICAESESRSGC